MGDHHPDAGKGQQGQAALLEGQPAQVSDAGAGQRAARNPLRLRPNPARFFQFGNRSHPSLEVG